MLYLGIDQHRKQLTVCVRNEEGDVILRRQVSTEWRRVRAFFAGMDEEAAGWARSPSRAARWPVSSWGNWCCTSCGVTGR